ncbi:MAG: transposase [Geobacteraceae bacterium]|nr:transposase [Geobacteraceae bacterium]
MKYNPDIHHRRSIRLRDYDYSAIGAYFVTVCAQGRECLFGGVVGGAVVSNEAGRMVAEWWAKLPDKFPGVELDEFIIMPNHFHAIVAIVGAPPCGCPPLSPCGCLNSNTKPGRPHGAEKRGQSRGAEEGRPHGAAPTLGDMIDWFKTMTTNAYIRGVKQSVWPPFPGRLWQRNYYERVIRNENELAGIREYIQGNPLRWEDDEENPAKMIS